MPASYPSQVFTKTTHTDNTDTILAADVNTIEDELVAIESAFLTTGFAHTLFPNGDGTFGLGKTGFRFLNCRLARAPQQPDEAATKAYVDAQTVPSWTAAYSWGTGVSYYQQFSNGLLIQWGYVTLDVNGNATANFSVAFGAADYATSFGLYSFASGSTVVIARNRANMSFGSTVGGADASRTCTWMAIGHT